MLHDILVHRYPNLHIRDDWYEADRRFKVQAAMMLRDVLGGPDETGKLPEFVEKRYRGIHDIVRRELGLDQLSARSFVGTNGTRYPYNWMEICCNFLKDEFLATYNVNRFILFRLSLVEQAYRWRWNEIQNWNAKLPEALENAKRTDQLTLLSSKRVTTGLPKSTSVSGVSSVLDLLNSQSSEQRTLSVNAEMNANWEAHVHELNERLRFAQYPFHFHNGFLQLSEDQKIAREIHEPFWALVADRKWANVDLQMKEAIDRRDSSDRTAGLHAMSALESVIKIISDEKGWTTGNEKGAANYVNNLGSNANGKWLAQWECEILKTMFTQVRNPFAHGPGAEKMPELSSQQTNWAIDTAMVWTRTLISRM